MKKAFSTLYFLLVLFLFSEHLGAQGLNLRYEIRDTNYEGYLFNKPLIHSNGACQGWAYTSYPGVKSTFIGCRYHTNTPIILYGIATTAWGSNYQYTNTGVGWETSLIVDGIDSLWAMIVRKEGDIFVGVDSVRWHNQFKPGCFYYNGKKTWRSIIYFPCGTGITPIKEFYFDEPITINDTFYVGLKNYDKVDTAILWATPGRVFTSLHGPAAIQIYDSSTHSHRQYLDDFLLLEDMELSQHYGNNHDISDPSFVFFPIIRPYEEDSVFCDTVPNFHWKSIRMGYPTFAWDTDWFREEDLFEVQFAPYRTSDWVTVSTADSSIEVYSVFDPDIYYQARIRARRHHLCPIHDTMMWGPWCDPILFYTGPTAPDTTSAITPVEANGTPFTLTPNPATGTVTVSYSTGAIPVPAHSSPPHSGLDPESQRSRIKCGMRGEVPFGAEECDKPLTITLTDATGREVLRKKFSIVNYSQPDTGQLSIDVSHFAAGIYLVTLTTPQGSSSRQLVVQ